MTIHKIRIHPALRRIYRIDVSIELRGEDEKEAQTCLGRLLYGPLLHKDITDNTVKLFCSDQLPEGETAYLFPHGSNDGSDLWLPCRILWCGRLPYNSLAIGNSFNYRAEFEFLKESFPDSGLAEVSNASKLFLDKLTKRGSKEAA